MRQSVINDYVSKTIVCHGSLLSSTARDFRKMYIQYMQSEASNTTAKEDMDETCRSIEVMARQLPFRELMDMAISDGIIDSYDDVYVVES